MDELYKVAKSNLTSTIFFEYNEMRENESFCDFLIKVGSKSFPVHRSLLIAASKYFKAMFSSNIKEVEQGFIDMKDVDAGVVKYCLEYIYTREIDLSIAPVELILHASHLMQLDDLTDLCFGYLKMHITPENCISTLKLAQRHDRGKLINIADQCIADYLEGISSTDSFFVLDQTDLIRHLNTYTVDHRVSWQVVMKWLSNRNECIYAMGGWGILEYANQFDPKTERWSKIALMNTGRWFASASAMNGMVSVMGGGKDGRLLNSVKYYNPVVGSGTEIANMCCFRYNFSSCVVNNKLYAVGGACNADEERLDPDSIEVYDEETGKWRIVQKMKLSQGGKIHCCVFSP